MRRILFVLLLCTAVYPKDYYGGELRTKSSFLYGRFETRMKSAVGSGLLSSFFMYHDTAPYNTWNEIDVEIMGRYQRDVQYNTITPDKANHVYADYVPFNPHADFHTYAVEWTPTYVAWFVDGVEAHRQTGSHIATLKYEQKIMMNIWQVLWTDWAGTFNPKILPVFAWYDFVSYASYTPAKGSVGSGNNFTLLWKDEFNAWDTSRWEKATHTFEGNNSDFTPQNVVFRDGYMVLCLTDKLNPGFSDKTTPTVLWARAQTPTTITVRFTEPVERTSAERSANYVIAGLSVQKAQLQADLLTAELTVNAWDPSRTYKLICSNLLDLATPANKMAVHVTDMVLSKPLSLPVYINVGGGSSGAFLADQEWSEKTEYGYQDGRVFTQSYSQIISGTDNQAIYRSERNDLKHYHVRLPNGVYKVTLMMAEQYWEAAGKRLMDITVQGQPIVSKLDLFASRGKHAAYELVVDPVTVRDGELDVHMAAQPDYALLNGIMIEQSKTGVLHEEAGADMNFRLEQNYPNPFNSGTRIKYYLPSAGRVQLHIFDISGRQLETRALGFLPAGHHEESWTGPIASGVYFYQVVAVTGDRIFTDRKKFTLLK
jgi:hypothetical protein